MAGLSWSVKLDDRISAGAKSAATSLGALGKKLDEVRAKSKVSLSPMTKVAGLDTATTKLGMFAKAVQLAGNTFGAKGANAVMALGKAFNFVSERAGALKGALSGLAAVGGVAMAALAAVGGVALGLGVAGAKYVIEAQAFKQSTMFAFKNLLGSQGAAEKAWQMAKATSLQTGMGLQETASALNQLVAVGFKLDAADTLIKQMADLKTLNPSANLEGIARAIGQIKNTGKLQGDDLMQLADAGLSTEAVYKQLEKQTGKTRAEILKMQAAGEIKSDMAIKAIQGAMSEQTGKAPGELAAEATRKTLAGAFGKLMAVKDAFVDNLNFDFTPITAFLDKVATALSGPAGKELGKAFELVFNTVMKMLDGITAADIAGFVSGVASAIVGVAKVIEGAAAAVGALRDAWDWIKGVEDSLNDFAGSTAALFLGLPQMIAAVGGLISDAIWSAILGPIGPVISAAWEALQGLGNIDLSGVGDMLSAKGYEIGSALVQGLLNSMFGGIGSVFSAGLALADAAATGTESGAQIASPSKRFGGIGDMMVAGSVNSLLAGAGQMFGAGLGLADAAAGGAENGKTPTVPSARPSAFVEAFPRVFGAPRDPAQAAAMPSAASVGSAAANVTNNTTTNARGPVSLSVSVQNADEAKIAGIIEGRLRSMDLAGG
jgi:tape measure domain-containing protein